MKLKKIASLALAGIMAVRMLTACGDTSNDNPNEEVPEVTPVSNANAAINNVLDENADVIEFINNDNLDAALATYYASHPIKGDSWTSKKSAENTSAAQNIASLLGVKYYGVSDLEARIVANNAGNNDTTKRDGLVVYEFNTKAYTEDGVLKYIGSLVDDWDLAEDSTDTNDDKVYSWTGSASVMELSSDSGDENIWVVAILITRDYVNA